MALDFGSSAANCPWLAALRWMKSIFARQQRLTQRPLDEIPENTIPKRLRTYLLNFDQDGNPVSLRGDRYELPRVISPTSSAMLMNGAVFWGQ